MKEASELSPAVSTYLNNSSYQNFTEPIFSEYALELAHQISKVDTDYLADTLKVNDEIAESTYKRYQHIVNGESILSPAVFSYNGIVFKSIAPEEFTAIDMEYAQSHLRITSFLYGLLRPLDLIAPYRLEGKYPLALEDAKNVFAYWKSKLTDSLIADTKAVGGVLCNLASREMQNLFDWKRVCREVRVVSPEFTITKGDKQRTIVVYTKIARGLMTKYIIDNQLTEIDALRDFNVDGYTLIDRDKMLFTKEI